MDYSGFLYPPCAPCGGLLKPHVVFFGENLPKERAALSVDLVENADVLVVAGTSLTVWSAFRLVRRAAERGAEIVVVTRGPTRADDIIKPELRFRCGAMPFPDTRASVHPRSYPPTHPRGDFFVRRLTMVGVAVRARPMS